MQLDKKYKKQDQVNFKQRDRYVSQILRGESTRINLQNPGVVYEIG